MKSPQRLTRAPVKKSFVEAPPCPGVNNVFSLFPKFEFEGVNCGQGEWSAGRLSVAGSSEIKGVGFFEQTNCGGCISIDQ